MAFSAFRKKPHNGNLKIDAKNRFFKKISFKILKKSQK